MYNSSFTMYVIFILETAVFESVTLIRACDIVYTTCYRSFKRKE